MIKELPSLSSFKSKVQVDINSPSLNKIINHSVNEDTLNMTKKNNSRRNNSRAISPEEDIEPTDKRTKKRRHAGNKLDFDEFQVLTMNQRLRRSVALFMQNFYVEVFFIFLVLFYGGVVIIQSLLDEGTNNSIAIEMNYIDIVIGSILLSEIVLKLYAYGFVYLRNLWNLFDGTVVISSFGLSIVATSGSSYLIVRILRLRVVLRLFRVLVAVERLRLKRSVIATFQNGSLTESPLEKTINILNELLLNPGLQNKTKKNVLYIMELIKSNRLYEGDNEAIENDKALDNETKLFLQGQIKSRDQKLNKKIQPISDTNSIKDGGNHSESNPNGRLSYVTQTHNIIKLKRSQTEQTLMPLDSENEIKLNTILQTLCDWEFDIFGLERITKGNALAHMGLFLLSSDDLCRTVLSIDIKTIVRYLLEVQRGYKRYNPYHNSTHAADVLQTVHYFISKRPIEEHVTPLDRVVCYLSAIIHDFKHDGFNNNFHVLRGSTIAIRYNDESVLENYHVAEAFALMKSAGKELDIFANLNLEDHKYSRSLMIEMVLGTDMSKHFKDVSLFKTKIVPLIRKPEMNIGENSFLNSNGSNDVILGSVSNVIDNSNTNNTSNVSFISSLPTLEMNTIEEKTLLFKLILHTADVSNPGKPKMNMLKWTSLVVEEFFIQGDKEKELGLTISTFYDRNNTVLLKMQSGFIDYIVKPLLELWVQLMPDMKGRGLKYIAENRQFWVEKGETFRHEHISKEIQDLTGSPFGFQSIIEETADDESNGTPYTSPR